MNFKKQSAIALEHCEKNSLLMLYAVFWNFIVDCLFFKIS